MRILMVLALTGALIPHVSAQVVHIIEAEECTIRRVDGKEPEFLPVQWASGGKKLGMFWGERKGDELEWTLELAHTEERLKLAIRYSFDRTMHRQMTGHENADRRLQLSIDDGGSIDVHVPDTRGWDDFESVYIELPKLSRGKHRFVLTSPGDHLTTDFDAFTFFRGNPQRVLTPAWRSVVVIRSSNKRFVVRMTPRAVVRQTPEQIVRDFNRIYDYFEQYMGWKPDRPVINICIYEKALARGAYENAFGIHFEDENFNWDRGNWIHEMNHVFDNGLFPDWSGHPMIRVNDTFVTGPQIFPEAWRGPHNDPQWAIRLNAGRKVLNNPGYRTDDPHEILYALYAKFGRDILRRFYKECHEAKARGEIKFVRAHVLTRDQYVTLMSKAAGQDVRRYFQQWTGFKDAK